MFAFILKHEGDRSALLHQGLIEGVDGKLYVLMMPGHALPLMGTSIYESVLALKRTVIDGMASGVSADVAKHLEAASIDVDDFTSYFHLTAALDGLRDRAIAFKAAPDVAGYWLSTVQQSDGNGTFMWTFPGMVNNVVGKSLTFIVSWEAAE